MTWQEYQEAVVRLYEQMEGFGILRRNVYLPDKVTGGNRQVDALLEIETKGHAIRMLIDAKFYSDPIDVKVVEEVLALAEAIGANKSVIVAPNGWTEPAGKKAEHESCDLRILSVENALEIIVTDKWVICSICGKDCVVLDQPGAIQAEGGLVIWWLAGQCRECKSALIHCQDCGERIWLRIDEDAVCACGYTWFCNNEGTCLDIQREFDR